MLKRGYKRLAKSTKRQPRIPITIWILQALLPHIPPTGPTSILFAIAVIGVFGLFRGGELTFKGSKYPILTRADVTWFDDHATLHLSESKTDIDRFGVDVPLFATGSSLCPVHWLHHAWNEAPNKHPHAPLFQDQTGRPVSYQQMLYFLRALLPKVGVPADRVGLHSLRIGGATSLALLGVPAHIIKTLGRWESISYQLYTRTSATQLRHASGLMAAAANHHTPIFGGLTLDQASSLSVGAISDIAPLVMFKHH